MRYACLLSQLLPGTHTGLPTEGGLVYIIVLVYLLLCELSDHCCLSVIL